MPDSRRDNGWDLEQELRDLGPHLEYPPTPDLARAARLRLEAEDEARENRRGLFWLPVLSPRWAVAAMFVIVLAVPALSPDARDALSGLFVTGGASSGAGGGAAGAGGKATGAEADKVMSGQAESQAAPSEAQDIPQSAAGGQPESDQAASGFPARGSGIGEASLGFTTKRITLQKARSRAGDAQILLPRAPMLGDPDEVYAAAPSDAGGVTLVYRARSGLPPIGETGIGLILTELPSGLGSVYLGEKPETVRLETVQFDDGPGYWVPGGRGLPKTAAGTAPPNGVLLWNRDGRALRMESALSRAEAVRIAESVR